MNEQTTGRLAGFGAGAILGILALFAAAALASCLTGCTSAQAQRLVTSGVQCLQAVIAEELAACDTEECRGTVREKYALACEQTPDLCENAEQIAGPVK